MAAALAQALEKLPADRFTSGTAFATALGDESFTYQIRPWPAVVAPPPKPVAALVPVAVVGLGTTAVLLAGLAAWGWLRPQPVLHPTRSVMDLGDATLRVRNEIVISPDGSRLAVAATRDGREAFYWRDAAARRASNLSSILKGLYNPFNWSLHPDGDRFVTTRPATSAQPDAQAGGAVARERHLIVVNWFEERLGN
jgi:hypothetical protein